jgi:hypothetical protein
VGEVDLPRELAGTRLGGGDHGGRRRRAQVAASGSTREARGASSTFMMMRGQGNERAARAGTYHGGYGGGQRPYHGGAMP